MKRFIALCMAGVMLMGTPVFADNLIYNGSVMTYSDQQPVIVNSRTYVPIRDVFEKLGFDVDWDANTKVVTISNDYYTINLLTGTSKIFVVDANANITAKKLENPVQVVTGRTMLPLREILEAVGYELDYDAATKSTTIKDVNDYTALSAKKAEIENISNYEGFEVDKSKPEGTLTDEEKAFVAELKKALSSEPYQEKYEAKYGAVDDITDLDEATINAFVKELSSEVKQNLTALDAPDSLKDVKTAIINFADSNFNKMPDVYSALKLLDGETDTLKTQLSFVIIMVYAVSVAADANDVNKAIDNFCAERNIDRDIAFSELSEGSMFKF
jgi:hypothetical protein